MKNKLSVFMILLITLVFNLKAKAQNMNGYKNLEILVGSNVRAFSPNISISYDKENTKALTYGINFNAQINNPKLYKSNDFTLSQRYFVTGGLYLKLRFAQSRNFTSDAQLGANIGYLNNDYLYYPNLKLKQSFYITPKVKLVIAEGLIYYIDKKWSLDQYDPQLHIGLCFHI